MTARLGFAFAALIALFIIVALLIASGAVVPRLLGVVVIAIGYVLMWIRGRRASR